MAYDLLESIVSVLLSAYAERISYKKTASVLSPKPCVKIHKIPVKDVKRDLSEALFIIAPEIVDVDAYDDVITRQYTVVRKPSRKDADLFKRGYKYTIENYRHTSFRIERIDMANRTRLAYEYKEDLFFRDDQDNISFLVEQSNQIQRIVISDGIEFYIFSVNSADSFLSLEDCCSSKTYHRKYN